MKRLLLFALMLFALPAVAQIQGKWNHSGTLTTSWTEKAMSGVSTPIRGYRFENYSTTATDTMWYAHEYSNRIDTASTYRSYLLPGDAVVVGPTNLSSVWIRAKASAPYQLTLWDK